MRSEPNSNEAWAYGFIGMLIFSGSMPATRAAVGDFDPFFVTAARAAIPAVLALATLVVTRSPLPKPEDWLRLAVVSAATVLGFPLFTALALIHITSSHSLIWIALLPLATALFAVLRASERPPAAFWGFASLGALCVVLFAASRASGAEATGDALMAAAVLCAGLGYAEGGRLARDMAGWRVVSWALVLALPISLPLAFWLKPPFWPPLGAPGWIGLAYVSLLSMWIGFVFWYRGLALGGIAAVGQLQLLQPFFGLVISGLVLRERVGLATFGTAAAVLLCVFAARRASMSPRPAVQSR